MPDLAQPTSDASAGALVEAGCALLKTYRLDDAIACFERALSAPEQRVLACSGLVSALIAARRLEAATDVVSRQLALHGQFQAPSVDDLCNRLLWAGRHAEVAQFLTDNPSIFGYLASHEPDGYHVDALLTYASEIDPALGHVFGDLYAQIAGRPFAYPEQLLAEPVDGRTELLFAAHPYAGGSAFVNLLLLLGVRVDECGRRHRLLGALDDGHDVWTLRDAPDVLPARLLQRVTIFRRDVRCYSFSHRLPAPSALVGRRAVFVVRDPRTALAARAKPTRDLVESGTFARMAQHQAQDWCDFVDGIAHVPGALVIRFEDWKADPTATARRVLAFADLDLRPSLLAEAVHWSGTEVARRLRAAVRPVTADAAPVTTEPPATDLDREYALVEAVCGPRLGRYGYDSRPAPAP
ncbi:MAG: hypothetical protein KIT14_24950 [bacterium]|nr:hypothetical protein [bacterium]